MLFSKKNLSGLVFILIGVSVVFLGMKGCFFSQKEKPVPPPRKEVAKPVPLKKVTGRIAVVLDDWGYNRSHCKQLASFDAPVAAAILPGLPYSRDVLECAKKAGKEAMLHLPIEPKVMQEKYPRGYFLTTEMSRREVRKQLQKTLDLFPGIAGVNNHEGSKGTEDPELMETVLNELKARKVFFVDSFTTAKSSCTEVADKIRIPFARRDVFLDNRNERAYIEKQFYLAAKIAKEKGFALVIGHDRMMTLQVLAEQIPKLRQQGYQFLTVRDYIKAKQK